MCSSFGRVVVAKRKTDRWPVAIKIVPMEVDVSSIRKEAETLKACNSMFIVGYQGVYTKGKELWVKNGVDSDGVLSLRIVGSAYPKWKPTERDCSS